ncbi:glucose-6-phosphate dehydrogenase assembly protein OpcA [Nocardia sp. NBC_01503]|uniref:glucose-6-phosphate dehydrogenase assembly protein OpcA n=1 Tax=Nocardia sp. NBC_01503 TaxID=2975997 RepID=UPI002E7B7A36|nr:glucose-6-phosphate dehydrogenase assembly protein OpcA [Nocardia sp. NBC_01503]WTL36462.1 glucose-6-phosphate dehydrogenase assembly protein OpcA [Nocardia sp. NBC_01503]
MIIDMPDTDTREVSKRLIQLREANGVVTMGRVLTLVVCTLDSSEAEGAIDAANDASREHPCRVIVLARGDRLAATRLDAQIRVGGDAGAAEVIVLRLQGELVAHESSVVVPFLLPDTPVVAWWPRGAPEFPSKDSVGRLATRRITDATFAPDPQDTIKKRRDSYAPGDTDLAWSRISYWRALLAAALDEAPFEAVESVTVSGLREEPALDMLAGWLAARLDCPVVRQIGELKVEMRRPTVTISISRPQHGRTATLTRTGEPDQRFALARRETRDCLAEELRHLDADDIYAEALTGIERVTYE